MKWQIGYKTVSEPS